MIVDFEHHLSTPEMLQTWGSKSGKIGRYWDPEGHLRIQGSPEAAKVESHLKFMDAAGIDLAVLTTNRNTDLQVVKNWNDFCGKLVREYPGRFAGYAATMPLLGQPALDEMDRAVLELGMKGVHIQARVQGHHLDSKALWPFYEKVSELGVPIDVHIEDAPSGYDALSSSYGLYYVIAREMDMCAATFRLCLGGVLEDFPDLIFIINHFGGGISAIKERMDLYTQYLGETFYRDRPLISRPWTEYFNKLYFNIAGREIGMDSLKCALTNIRPSKLLFGTDWPWNFEDDPQGAKKYIRGIKNLDLPQKDIDDILGGTAARLLGIPS
ncbi:MAG: amidohydrolase family protein [Desulfobacterales bacterium]|nr:amidohydrolase family protein [Desulfobacterales bacterium]